MTDLLRQYAKGVRAFLGLVFLWAYSVRHGGVSGDEWWGLGFIVAGTLGVVDVANTPAQWRPRHRARGDDGYFDLNAALALVVLVLLVLLLLKALGYLR